MNNKKFCLACAFVLLFGLLFCKVLVSMETLKTTAYFSATSHYPDSFVLNGSRSDIQSIAPSKSPPAQIGSRYVKIVWMYWDQGLENLESLRGTDSKYASDANCVRATRILNPGWDVRFLDKQAAMKLAPKFAILAKDTLGIITAVKASNVLRLELLAKFGGVWLDTSICPFRPLDEFIPSLVSDSGFFSPPFNKEAARMYGSKLEKFRNCHEVEGMGNEARSNMNWFLVAAYPHHIIFEAWLDRLFDRMLIIMKANPAVDFPYYIAHCTFTQARLANSTVEGEWKQFMGSRKSRFMFPSDGDFICVGGTHDCGKKALDEACELIRRDPEFVKQRCYILKKPVQHLSEYVLSSRYIEYIESVAKNPIVG